MSILPIMNNKQQQKTGKIIVRTTKSIVASPLKKNGLDSGISKEAAATIVNNVFGIKSAEPAPNNAAFVPAKPSVTMQVNSGNVVAGYGARGQVTVNSDPLRIQKKASIRTMSSPNTSIEYNLPIMSRENFSVHVGGAVKVERHRRPEYKAKAEIKLRY